MSRFQRITAGFVALSIAAAMAGVPVPMPAVRAPQKGAWYPCRDHLCGCTSAAQCLKGCCCYGHKSASAGDDHATHHHAAGVTIGALECRGITLGVALAPPMLHRSPTVKPNNNAKQNEPLTVLASQLLSQHAPIPDAPPPRDCA